MAKRSLLSPAIERPSANTNETVPAPRPAPLQSPRSAGRAGKYHLGGYFDPADPIVEGFRILAAKSRRTQQDLMAEALSDLIAKHNAQELFGR